MPFSFNPFYRIIESKEVIKQDKGLDDDVEEQPSFSRIYRRTLWEKIKDTFVVIAGNRAYYFDDVSENDKGHVARPGVLDYFTFQITRIINAVTFWSWTNVARDPIALMLIIPTSVLFVTANIIHYTLAGALTAVVSPAVLIVHVFSELLGGSALKNQAGKLHGNTTSSTSTADHTLNGFLKEKGYSYSDIIIDLKKTSDGKYSSTLLVMDNHEKYECCLNGPCNNQKGHMQFIVDVKNLPAEDKIAIEALIKMNAGSFRDNLRDHKHLQEFEQIVRSTVP